MPNEVDGRVLLKLGRNPTVLDEAWGVVVGTGVGKENTKNYILCLCCVAAFSVAIGITWPVGTSDSAPTSSKNNFPASRDVFLL